MGANTVDSDNEVEMQFDEAAREFFRLILKRCPPSDDREVAIAHLAMAIEHSKKAILVKRSPGPVVSHWMVG